MKMLWSLDLVFDMGYLLTGDMVDGGPSLVIGIAFNGPLVLQDLLGDNGLLTTMMLILLTLIAEVINA